MNDNVCPPAVYKPTVDLAVMLLRRVLMGQLHTCSKPIHSDALGKIYGCSYPNGHDGLCETPEERATRKPRIPTLEQDILAYLNSTVAEPLPVQDEQSGVAAIFGTWPGDESDAQLLAALDEVRKLGTCADFPTTPHPKGTCENCDMWEPIEDYGE